MKIQTLTHWIWLNGLTWAFSLLSIGGPCRSSDASVHEAWHGVSTQTNAARQPAVGWLSFFPPDLQQESSQDISVSWDHYDQLKVVERTVQWNVFSSTCTKEGRNSGSVMDTFLLVRSRHSNIFRWQWFFHTPCNEPWLWERHDQSVRSFKTSCWTQGVNTLSTTPARHPEVAKPFSEVRKVESFWPVTLKRNPGWVDLILDPSGEPDMCLYLGSRYCRLFSPVSWSLDLLETFSGHLQSTSRDVCKVIQVMGQTGKDFFHQDLQVCVKQASLFTTHGQFKDFAWSCSRHSVPPTCCHQKSQAKNIRERMGCIQTPKEHQYDSWVWCFWILESFQSENLRTAGCCPL